MKLQNIAPQLIMLGFKFTPSTPFANVITGTGYTEILNNVEFIYNNLNNNFTYIVQNYDASNITAITRTVNPIYNNANKMYKTQRIPLGKNTLHMIINYIKESEDLTNDV